MRLFRSDPETNRAAPDACPNCGSDDIEELFFPVWQCLDCGDVFEVSQ